MSKTKTLKTVWIPHPNPRTTTIYHCYEVGAERSLCNKVNRTPGQEPGPPPPGRECARCTHLKAKHGL